MLFNSSLTLGDILAILITLIISMSLHEFMHAYAGYKLGDTTAKLEGRLTLNPLKSIDPFMTVILPAITLVFFGFPILAAKPVPFNPYRVKFNEYGAAILAFAGPLTNLLLSIVGVVIFRATNPTDFLFTFIKWFIFLNVILFVFNLIPIPPLDGSRILYAFAPEGFQNFLLKIERYGFFIIIAFILLGGSLLGNLYYDVFNFVLKI